MKPALEVQRHDLASHTAHTQGTQLPCFQILVQRLSELGSEDAAERLMEHQLFQALLLAELEAEMTGAPGVFDKVPEDTLQAIRK